MLAGKDTVIPAVLHGVGHWQGYETMGFGQAMRGMDVPVGWIRVNLTMPDRIDELMKDPHLVVGPNNGNPEELPALLEALQNKAGSVRTEAAENLGLFGRHAKLALPALLKALTDPVPLVRIKAAGAVLRLDARQQAAISLLLKAMHDPDVPVRIAAVEAIGEIGPSVKPAFPVLITMLQDANPTLRWAAADALGQFGPEAEAAIQPLVEALNDAATYHRWLWTFWAGSALSPNRRRPCLLRFAGTRRPRCAGWPRWPSFVSKRASRKIRRFERPCRSLWRGCDANRNTPLASHLVLEMAGCGGEKCAAGRWCNWSETRMRRLCRGHRGFRARSATAQDGGAADSRKTHRSGQTARAILAAEALWRINDDAATALSVCQALLKDDIARQVRASLLKDMGGLAEPAAEAWSARSPAKPVGPPGGSMGLIHLVPRHRAASSNWPRRQE